MNRQQWKEDLKKRLKENDEQRKRDMKKWWDEILPKNGSYLRQLVDKKIASIIDSK